MKKLLVMMVLILVIAVPAMAQWSYLKGEGSRNWGSMPSVTGNGWTINEPAGATLSEYGVLWMNIAALPVGAAVNLSFTLNSVNLPALGKASGEGDGNLWTEVFIVDMATAGNAVTAETCFSGSIGSWTDRMNSWQVYNAYDWVKASAGYPGIGQPGYGDQGWQTGYDWHNTLGSSTWFGKDSSAPTGGYKINDSHAITKNIASSSGNLFIGIKTGVNQTAGANQSKGTSYGVNVTNMNIQVIPVPEPSSLLALGSGLMGLAGFAIRRRK